jgi:hypothetical protein
MFPPRVSYLGPILHEISGLLLRGGERDHRLSATRLGGMFAVTCHPLGPPKVAGPLQAASMCCRRTPSLALRAGIAQLQETKNPSSPPRERGTEGPAISSLFHRSRGSLIHWLLVSQCLCSYTTEPTLADKQVSRS